MQAGFIYKENSDQGETEKKVRAIVLEIASENNLINILDQNKIDYSKWRKTPSDLFKEIKEGETVLKLNDSRLERHTNTVLLKIISPDGRFQLVEDRQVFNDGRIVRRELKEIAEKFKTGEEPESVALRAISEELLNGEEFDTSTVNLTALPSKDNQPPKSAYDGLYTANNTKRFLVRLPDELFQLDGYVETQEKKTNYLVWEEIE